MSPKDQVERVLKDIHIFFTKCQKIENEPGMVKVDQKQFMELLERLNYGLYEVLDYYEQTQQTAGKPNGRPAGRENRLSAMRRNGPKMCMRHLFCSPVSPSTESGILWMICTIP